MPRVVPAGTAPEHIKKQWVDVPLPLRQQSVEKPEIHLTHDFASTERVRVIRDGRAIFVIDAIKSLKIFDRVEAAQFWQQAQEIFYPDNTLVFRGYEGVSYPTSVLQRILPGIEFFDSTEVG